jgi:hypothetical protein
MTFSIQSYVIAIVYLICLVIFTVIGIIAIPAVFRTAKMVSIIMLTFFILVGFIVLLAFDTNCLTEGGCSIWSWIRTVLNLIIPILFVVMVIIALVNIKKMQSENNVEEELKMLTL